jgi:hypothetical protein
VHARQAVYHWIAPPALSQYFFGGIGVWTHIFNSEQMESNKCPQKMEQWLNYGMSYYGMSCNAH